MELAEPKQCVDGLNVSADWGRSRVVIQHELLDEAAMILLYPGLFPHGSWMQCLLMKFGYTACLNLVVSSSESDLSLVIFLSTICPRVARLACDLAGRKCRLSAPCAPVGGWYSSGYGEWKMIWNQLLLVSSASRSCQQHCSRLY
jgi:hypothetical protein